MIVRQKFTMGGSLVLGGQAPIAMDFVKNPFNASVTVDIVSGAASYTVEFTTDDMSIADPTAYRWLPCPEFTANNAASASANIGRAVTGLRLNIGSMTGEVRFAVIQGVRI
jgi:hypothetical protein